MNITFLAAFLAASLVVLVIPGPGVIYVLARTLGQGYRAGLISVLGLSFGALAHAAAAAIGLSAILLGSATAFNIVKALGAGYLIYLGIQTLLNRSAGASGIEALPPAPARRLFIDGTIVSIFNPKIAIFFLAFLPQFVDPALGRVPGQLMVLGLLYSGLALLTDGAYCLLAGRLRQVVAGRFMQGPWPRYLVGITYLGLGTSTALTGRRL